MRPEFMTSMSCDCMTLCGAAWSSRWLMTQLTNGERAFVRASGGHFEHTLWLSICFLCTWWTLCFTPCLTQRVIFKECIIKAWNVMFSFSGSVGRWGGHFFCHGCIKYFFILTTVQNYKNRSRFSRVMITNVLRPFYGSQCISLENERD